MTFDLVTDVNSDGARSVYSPENLYVKSTEQRRTNYLNSNRVSISYVGDYFYRKVPERGIKEKYTNMHIVDDLCCATFQATKPRYSC